MKKLVIFFAVLIALVGLAIVIVPIIIDPNQYKTEIAQKFKEATGFEIEIGGEIELSLLPNINVSAGDISIANGSKIFAETKQASAHLQLMPIFSGEYKVDYILLDTPKIRLEKNGGVGNWETAAKKEANTQSADDASSEAAKEPEISLEDIRIKDGLFSYREDDKFYEFTEINLNAGLEKVKGPLDLEGNLKFQGEDMKISAQVENFDAPKIAARINAIESEIDYEGGIKGGALKVKSADINKVLEKIGEDTRFANPALNLQTNLVYDADKLSLTNLGFTFGGSQGKGNFSVDMNGLVTLIESDLQFSKLMVEELVPQNQASKAPAKTSSKPELGAKEAKISASISAMAEELYYKKGVYKKALVNAEIEGKEISFPSIYAELPGGGAAQIIGILAENSKGIKNFDGKLEVNAKNLRNVLSALEIEVPSIKNEKLKQFYIDTKLYVNIADPLNIEMSGIKGKLDDSSFNGALDVTLNKTPKITYRGGISGFDVDSYLAKKQNTTTDVKQASIKKKANDIDLSGIANFPLNLDVTTAIGSLKFNDENISNINLNGKFEAGVFDAKSLSFASRYLSANGKVKISTKQARPKIDVDLNIGEIDLDKFETASSNGSSKKKTANKKGEARWSDEPFDFTAIDQFDAELKLRIAKLKKGNIVLDNTKIAGYKKNDELVIETLNSKSFDGNIDVNGKVALGVVPKFDANFQAIGVDVYKFLKGFANIDTARGLLSIGGNIKSSGATQKAMVANLKANTEIGGTNIYISGFDLDGFASQIVNLRNPQNIVALLKNASDRRGTTHIRSLKGNIFAEKGVAQTNGITMNAGAAQGVYSGVADLNKWYTDGNAEFKISMPDDKERPSIFIRLFGPIDDVKKEIDSSAIRKYVTDRITRGLLKRGVEVPEKYQGIVDSLVGGGAAKNNSEGGEAKPKSQEEQLFDLFRNQF